MDLKQAHPDEPWLWRDDWARGQVHAGARTAATAAWIFALLWNAIAWPSTVLAFNQFRQSGNRLILLVALFPLAGIAATVAAARRLKAWRQYGESIFTLESIPGQIGGSLKGVISLQHPVPALKTIRLELKCTDSIRTGNDRIRKALWSDADTVTSDGSNSIPVGFYIPPDCRATDSVSDSDHIRWDLTVLGADLPVPYAAQFEVPVFQVKETGAQVSAASELKNRHQSRVANFQRDSTSKVRMRLLSDGSTEFYFPAFRTPVPALQWGAFALIWTGATVALFYLRAPLFFRIVWTFFDATMVFLAAAIAFGSTRVVIRSGTFSLTWKILGIPLRHIRKTAAGVAEIRRVSGMGSNLPNPYSQIRIIYKGFGAQDFGDGIADPLEASWLASKMSEALGLQQSTS